MFHCSKILQLPISLPAVSKTMALAKGHKARTPRRSGTKGAGKFVRSAFRKRDAHRRRSRGQRAGTFQPGARPAVGKLAPMVPHILGLSPREACARCWRRPGTDSGYHITPPRLRALLERGCVRLLPPLQHRSTRPQNPAAPPEPTTQAVETAVLGASYDISQRPTAATRASLKGTAGRRVLRLGLGGIGTNANRAYAVAAGTRTHRALTKQLFAWFRANAPAHDACASSIAIARGNRATTHRDAKNVGDTYVASFGNFTGGALGVLTEAGKEGVTRVSRRRLLAFNARKPHFTSPWQGTRASVTFYTHRALAHASPQTRRVLARLGATFPPNLKTVSDTSHSSEHLDARCAAYERRIWRGRKAPEETGCTICREIVRQDVGCRYCELYGVHQRHPK